jgi:transcriptional regulator with XRE-family HTH domain
VDTAAIKGEPVMTSTAIKEELIARGIQNKDLAAELGISKTAISLVIHGKSTSDRVQRAIAAKIGKDPEFVFPDYYQRKQLTKPNERENARGNP